MGAKNPFRVGITHDFETHAKGVLAPALAEVFDRAGGIEYEIMPDTGGVGAPEKLDAYDGIIVLDYAFPAPSFQGLSRLAVLARWGVGCDRLDLNAATEADVIVAITTDSVRRPVAEGIFALIFALARNLRALDRNIRAGEWRRDPPRVIDIEGRTLGSIGLGNIAGEMFRMARGVGFGPSRPRGRVRKEGRRDAKRGRAGPRTRGTPRAAAVAFAEAGGPGTCGNGRRPRGRRGGRSRRRGRAHGRLTTDRKAKRASVRSTAVPGLFGA